MKANRKKAEALDLASYWQSTLEEGSPFHDQDFIDALHTFMEIPPYNVIEGSNDIQSLKVRSFHRRMLCGILARYTAYQPKEKEQQSLAELFFGTYVSRLNRFQRLLIYLVP